MSNGGCTAERTTKGKEITSQADRLMAQLRGMIEKAEGIESSLGVLKPRIEKAAEDKEKPNGFFPCLKANLETVEHLAGQVERSLENIKSEL